MGAAVDGSYLTGVHGIRHIQYAKNGGFGLLSPAEKVAFASYVVWRRAAIIFATWL
jgi:hypothetical protein